MKPEFERADPAALAAFDDPRSPEERRFLCPDCETVKLPRQQDFDWADRQLPAGITRQDVCIWTQDSDGPWNTSCGVTWEFVGGGPAENGAHFCHHCGGVLMAAPFADDDAQPNAELSGAERPLERLVRQETRDCTEIMAQVYRDHDDKVYER